MTPAKDVSERLTALEVKMEAMMTNHLPHIQAAVDELDRKVDSINTKLAMWSGGIVVSIWIIERFAK